MTDAERETAGAVRSAHVAHFFPPDWTQTAQRASGALERTDRELPATQLLIIVPDAAAAVAVARELRALPAASGVRVLPATSAKRAARLLHAAPAQVVIGAPGALAELLAASALKLASVHTALLAAADEYGAQQEALGALMAELPRGCARVLTAAEPTPLVENLLERYMHKARRVTAPASPPVPVAPGTPATIYVRIVPPGGALAPLAELLDDLDPPSTAIVVSDSRSEGQAHTALETLGYPADSSLVRVTRGDVALHTALVIFVGLPEPSALTAALDAHPARLLALITARQRPTLEKLTRGTVLMPYEHSRAARAARAHEAALRATLRATLSGAPVAREILALEPLLAEYDGLEIAGAALRLYEKAQADASSARLEGREEVRQEIKAARAASEAAEAPRAPRERGFEHSARGGDRSPRGGERSPRGGERSFGGPPRGGERSFGGPPRGDRPFTRSPRVDSGKAPRSGHDASGSHASRFPKHDDKGRPPRKDR